MTMEAILNNYPLIAAIVAILSAQFIKFPIDILINKKVDPLIMFSTGGMPSSHSAFVSSLTVAIAFQFGVDSPYFAISTVFALITMWDAGGVRYQASMHAQTLNVLINDFRQLAEYIKYRTNKDSLDDNHIYSPLKELLGHKPFEVLVGAIYGFLVALLFKNFYL